MKNTVRLIFTSLAFISVVAHADETTVALANLAGVSQYTKPGPVIENTDPVRRKVAFDILQKSSSLRFQVDSPIGDVWFDIDDFSGSFSLLNDADHSNIAAIEANARSLVSSHGIAGIILRGESFLDVENFPRLHFAGRSIEWSGDKYAVLKGELTIKGTTREVAFYVELISDDINRIEPGRIRVNATTTIKRSEFGICTLIPVVSDYVNLYIKVDAVERGAPLSMAFPASSAGQ